MQNDKQQLLKRYRRQKRGALLLFLFASSLIAYTFGWLYLPLLWVLLWLAHEAWFSDHLFYSPKEDQRYRFANAAMTPARIEQDALGPDNPIPAGTTAILAVTIRASWLGHFLDPHVTIDGQRFDFERGAAGKRYLNLGAFQEPWEKDARSLCPQYCTLAAEAELHVFTLPDFRQQRLMIIAPHADDAELAAFGLYSGNPETLIVTVTQGEAEAEGYKTLGLTPSEAARLKGRLRSWDSMSVPLWGGIPQSACVQLGYSCMQLSAMAKSPELPVASPYSGDCDVRPLRRWNTRPLPSDQDGQPTWNNLLADLAHLIDDFQPQAIVLPHPQHDPHPDHVAASQAVTEALARTRHQPAHLLHYANHLHNNDRWPMGPAGGGVTLPPVFDDAQPAMFWSLPLSPATQLDKAMALGMQHDLQGPVALKKRVRRLVQCALAGRQWPTTGDNEFFRKAVRSQELFWVSPWSPNSSSGNSALENH